MEGENRFSIFNPANVTLTQAGTNGIAANAAYKQNYNLEPRLGFAWDVFGTGKTVVRGGYGYLVDQPVSGAVTALAAILHSPPRFPITAPRPFLVSSLYTSAKAASGICSRRSIRTTRMHTSRASTSMSSRRCPGAWSHQSATTARSDIIC